MWLEIDTEGAYLLRVKKTPIKDPVDRADFVVELAFEEHSMIDGDNIKLKMSAESIQRLKELL